ncbi:hypothetical protein RM96_19460 [Cupriavidus sp. IDO]|nr:hypothetical protein RM96_19460 [Cupriavidus sp. IDO]
MACPASNDFQKAVALNRDLGPAAVGPETLERDQLMGEQRLYIRAVQLGWVRAVVYQYQRCEFMMAQHSRLLSNGSMFATGLHYCP